MAYINKALKGADCGGVAGAEEACGVRDVEPVYDFGLDHRERGTKGSSADGNSSAVGRGSGRVGARNGGYGVWGGC
jgi:hypothetical protein